MAGPGSPSHRSEDEPQPEVCGLCGTIVPAHTLRLCDVEGLRGHYVCDVTPGCRRFRASPSWNDRRQLTPRPSTTIGDSRVYPAATIDTPFD
jgi:hypothetical protein